MSLRRIAVVLMLLLILSQSKTCSAETTHVWKLTIEQIPTRLLLHRGDQIEFSGKLIGSDNPQTVMLQCGSFLRGFGEFEHSWRIRWDSENERYSSCRLSLWRIRPSGGLTEMARCHVILMDNDPALITSPAANSLLYGPVPLVLKSATGVEIRSVEWTEDDATLPVHLKDGKDIWDTRLEPEGARQLGGTAVTADGFTILLPPVPVVRAAPISILPFPFGELIDPNTLNGEIEIRAQIPPAITPSTVIYRLDDKTILQNQAAPFNRTGWNYSELTRGAHRLSAELITKEGAHFKSQDYEFICLASSEERLRAGDRLKPANSAKNLVSALSGPVSDLPSVCYARELLPKQLLLQQGMNLSITGQFENVAGDCMMLRLDGRPADCFRHYGLYSLTLETAGLSPGPHRLMLRLERYDGTSAEPIRCLLTICPKSPLELQPPANPSDLVHPVMLATTFPTDLRLRSLAFYRDGRYLRADPIDLNRAFWDVRGELPGEHRLRAVAVSKEGVEFRSAEVRIVIPERVAMQSPGDLLQFTEQDRVLGVQANLWNELNPRMVDYLLNGIVVARRSAPPFDHAMIDTRYIPTGTHVLVARVVNSDGARYLSDYITFSAANTRSDAVRLEQEEGQPDDYYLAHAPKSPTAQKSLALLPPSQESKPTIQPKAPK